LAGDWTDTGYPAVLEGAVRSGKLAASTLIEALQRSNDSRDAYRSMKT
jgi:monoamine oxidase